MDLQIYAKVTPDEIDQRNFQQYGFKITAFSFVASVVLLTFGVVLLNLTKLNENLVVLGAIYLTVGLLFLLSGLLLVMGIATKRVVFFNLWFGAVAVLVVFHLYHLGNAVKVLAANGEEAKPDAMVALFYGANFGFAMTSVLIQGFCVALIARYRGYVVLHNLPYRPFR